MDVNISPIAKDNTFIITHGLKKKTYRGDHHKQAVKTRAKLIKRFKYENCTVTQHPLMTAETAAILSHARNLMNSKDIPTQGRMMYDAETDSIVAL